MDQDTEYMISTFSRLITRYIDDVKKYSKADFLAARLSLEREFGLTTEELEDKISKGLIEYSGLLDEWVVCKVFEPYFLEDKPIKISDFAKVAKWVGKGALGLGTDAESTAILEYFLALEAQNEAVN